MSHRGERCVARGRGCFRRILVAMARQTVDFETVREVALALPDVATSTTFGATSFKLRGKLLACPAIHRSAEAGTLMVRIDFDLRRELLATEPDVYYLTPHYEPYPAVLVRLARIRKPALRKLLGTAWVFVDSKTPQRRAPAKKRKQSAARKRGGR
jgi:hypothetical protein